METCFLFFCLPVVMVEDLKPPGTVLWQESGWQVVVVVRNDDTTDRGCRLVRSGEHGGRLELDAHFLAGRFFLSLPQAQLEDGPANFGLFGITGENEDDGWGITSMTAMVTGDEIVADIPGASVPELLKQWSDRHVTNLALLDVHANKWLVKIDAPDLAEASTAFVDCYTTVPTGQQ